MGYGDKETDLKANKSLLAPDGYDWIIDQAYDICEKGIDGGLITPIFTKAVESTSEYSTDLNSLWQEAYVDCITCSPDQFESKYAEYSQEYLDAGKTEAAHNAVVYGAKILALTGAQLIEDPEKLEAIKKEFHENLAKELNGQS